MEKCIYIKQDGEVLDFTGLYAVNEEGVVRSIEKGLLKPQLKRNGYNQVTLQKGGKRYYCKVSRLVASTYQNICGEWFEGAEVDHINTKRTEDAARNLKWVSRSTNHQNPLTKQHRSVARRNRPDQSKKVLQFDLEGTFIREWPSTMEIQRQTGYINSNIGACCSGKYKQAYGSIWKYKGEN